jgi:hypothetical protein
MDVGALTRKGEIKRRKHKSHNGGSAGPLYFKGFLGELRSLDYGTRDSIWGLKGIQSVVEPQHVPIVPATEAPQIVPPNIETSPQVNAK